MYEVARPSKFNQNIAASIIEAIEKGASETAAAEAHGIHRDTLANWRRLGEAGDKRYSAFAAELTRARAACEVDLTGVVFEAALVDREWKAALEVLARRNPEEWGRKDIVEQRVDKKVQETLAALRGQVSDDAFRQLAIAVCTERGLDPQDVLGTVARSGSDTAH